MMRHKRLARRRLGGRRSGFTHLDLLVVLLLVPVFGFCFVACYGHEREPSNRVKCASNLKQIGQALLLYSNENANSIYPRTGYRPDAPPDLSNLGADTAKPFAAGNPFDGKNNVPSVLYLLARTEDLTMAVFTCPTGDADVLVYQRGGIEEHSNFAVVPGNGKSGNLSFSIHNPYFSKAAAADGAKWDNTLTADFAVAADLNPGQSGGQDPTAVTPASSAKDVQRGNSLNHNRVGQNVLFGDGHVDFVNTPFVGVNRDNIYGYAPPRTKAADAASLLKGAEAVGVVGSPTHKDDSVLLPTR